MHVRDDCSSPLDESIVISVDVNLDNIRKTEEQPNPTSDFNKLQHFDFRWDPHRQGTLYINLYPIHIIVLVKGTSQKGTSHLQ